MAPIIIVVIINPLPNILPIAISKPLLVSLIATNAVIISGAPLANAIIVTLYSIYFLLFTQLKFMTFKNN